ncbi:phage tail spike protein [Streptococcus parasanguinis]|uniref:phage tail spike protein n=1 Tax=Streptococcus parasanguinis TaxID=1318 RepID=UPI0020C88DF4|nr:phage tail spike protein [Streptococcus parasanguinis]MCP8990081.1 gp58-like family protein [Streptococcus parasanguinis]MCP8991776.1 gp58-like family protein [Streptococcus parasanguinis]MCP9002866.1 gp58-like family protein [Streptococcus parasanguinis]MCP9009130.1 gp58-like family protein [Streptococcus parasanguinis]MCP9034811.1 gp58-like family protein [Streptococcus parasanguinis]
MRPILFNKNETAFDTYGLGELNVTKGTVTRERNGNYTLYSEIPANDPMVATLEKEMKLKADAGLRTKNQTFEISRIVKDSSNIAKIYGQHISHKLEYMAIRNGVVLNGTAFNALSIWRGALIGDYHFDVWSDIQTTAKGVFDISKMENARLALGGVEGSILDIYGGEYEFDNMTVRLHKQLGRTAPTVLEYGRNILSAESDETIENSYTSVLPFATYTPDKPEGDTSDNQPDPVTVTLPENYVDSKYKALYAHRRIKVVDFSSEFKSDSKSKDIPTPDKLRKIATDYMERNAIGKPKINIKIEYADLAKTLDYADNGWIEELELCDIVPIYYPQIGLTDETAKVTTITYDFVNERNESVEFGDIGTNVRATMQSGLAGKVDDIAKAQQNFENSLPDYLLNAQGNKVWYNKPDGKEHKIGDIWFEKNGLYDRMYVWNGSQWEKRIDTEEVDKIKKEVDKQLEEAKKSTAIEIEKANAKAQEALIKAGTIPDTATLSDRIKTLILNSPDLSRKVTETFNNADNGDTIYSKVYSKVAKNFASRDQFENIDREQNRQGSDLLSLSKKIETQTVEFNKLTESNKLYERILGTSETDAPNKLSRLVMSSEIFQTEVGKYVTDDNNLIVNSMTMSTNTLIGNNNPKADVSVNDGIFTIKAQGLTGYNWTGFTLPIYVKKIYHGETYTLGFKYRIREYPDVSFAFNIKNHGLNKTLTWANIGENRPPLDEWHEFQKTFTMQEDFIFGEDKNYPFYIFLAKNGWVEFKEPILVRGSNTGPYKPSQFDDAFAETKAVRTQMSLLAGSWAVRNLNSNGDVLNSINVLADGTNRIDGRLTHITGQTKIDNAVIKDGMIANLNADKITGGTIDASQVNVINVNAGNVLAGTLTSMTVRGGRIEGLNGKMYIDLQNSQYNVLNNEATIRRIDDTNSSQFIKLTKSGFIAERFRDSNAALMVFGTNHDKTEKHDNETFTGIRLWSGKGNGTEESLTEFVGDRVLIYNNGRYRSPWNFHGNTNDGNAYLIPMNQNGVKHFIGRGDFFLEGIYSRKFYMSGGIDIGDYIWDLLTCFGEMAKNNMLGGAKNHITGVLRKRGYRI